MIAPGASGRALPRVSNSAVCFLALICATFLCLLPLPTVYGAAQNFNIFKNQRLPNNIQENRPYSLQSRFDAGSQQDEGTIHFPDHNVRLSALKQPKSGAMQFAWSLFKTTILPQEGNAVICPILPQTLLASLYDAADNSAKYELRSSLMASSQDLQPLIRDQLMAANGSSVNTFDYAMAYFLGADAVISKDIHDKALQDGVSFQQVNFLNRNEAAATANRWVTEKTRGTIREIVAPNALDSSTRLLMASVIYFKGKWKYQFTKTDMGLFEPSTDKASSHQVPMMYQFNKFRYGEKTFSDGNGMRWIELPYEGSKTLSMILMLPMVRHQLQRSAEQLTVEDVSDILAGLKQPRTFLKVHLSVPRFSVFSSSTLVPALKSMGLRSIFERSSALSGLSNEQLVVRDVTQRTFVTIDEQGTTASSAASLSFVALSAAPPLPTINFTVNEPFLLMIVDKTHEYPMFVAKVTSPETH
ncbi:leukocyte elastase inhibitor-like [Anopheles nili]|uniref:leukocyte elastase inhibitor-like n=1 Tax=Anopheles nili TaxID=185578 RepID=UPI00237AC91B|nr:leukocyte elastase inhibitor-like [Anopheles nili]